MKKMTAKIAVATLALGGVGVGTAAVAQAYTATCAVKISDSGPVNGSTKKSAVIKLNNSCGKAHKFKIIVSGGPDDCKNIPSYTTVAFTYVAYTSDGIAAVSDVVYC